MCRIPSIIWIWCLIYLHVVWMEDDTYNYSDLVRNMILNLHTWGCSRLHSDERYDDSEDIVCYRVTIHQHDNLIISKIFFNVNYRDKY